MSGCSQIQALHYTWMNLELRVMRDEKYLTKICPFPRLSCDLLLVTSCWKRFPQVALQLIKDKPGSLDF